MKKTYFASDFHLGIDVKYTSRERERQLVRWLDQIKSDAEALYLVGDVFDFWFEYKHAVPKGYVRLLGKLAELSDAGVSIYYFIGNHDMWMFRYLEDEMNIPIYRKPITRQIHDKTFFIGHGDGLGPGDTGYKIIKKVFANPVCQWLFHRLHPNFGIGLANYWSGRSRESNHDESQFLGTDKEWLLQYANRKVDEVAADFFVFGHRHLPIDYTLKNGTSRYINLGDWMNYNSYAVFDGQDMSIHFLKIPMEKSYAVNVSKTRFIQIATGILVSFLLLAKNGFTQTDSLVSSLIIPIEAIHIELDPLGNSYAITLQNEVIKYNAVGKKQFAYSDNTLGNLAVLDVSNPLEILLYYPDFQVLKILDRTLSEIQTMDLRRLNIFQIPSLCSSADGNIWLFDQDRQRVLKINRTGRILLESADLRTQLTQNVQATRVQEIDNQVYIHDFDLGLVQLDAFGNYKQTLAYQGLTSFQILENHLFYIDKKDGRQVQIVDLSLGKTKSQAFPFEVKKAIYQKGKWMVLGDSLKVFRF